MLLKLPSLEYQISLNIYQHLKDIKINDHDKIVSYVHVKLEVSHYTRIKMQERPKVGFHGEPIAELMKLSWVILSPGKKPFK